jgi:hypothetical protein
MIGLTPIPAPALETFSCFPPPHDRVSDDNGGVPPAEDPSFMYFGAQAYAVRYLAACCLDSNPRRGLARLENLPGSTSFFVVVCVHSSQFPPPCADYFNFRLYVALYILDVQTTYFDPAAIGQCTMNLTSFVDASGQVGGDHYQMREREQREKERHLMSAATRAGPHSGAVPPQR